MEITDLLARVMYRCKTRQSAPMRGIIRVERPIYKRVILIVAIIKATRYNADPSLKKIVGWKENPVCIEPYIYCSLSFSQSVIPACLCS